MGDVQRANVGAGATRVSSDNWLLNLTALTEGLQGVNLTEGVDIQGWVVNITAVIEDIPLSQYLPHYTAREWFQLVVTLVCVLLGTQWTITRYQKWRRAQKGWYFALRESKHARLILPPECVTEAPLRSPLIRGTKKVMRKILRKKRNGEYTGITSIDPSLLPEDSIPLLVFVNSRSGGQLGGYLFNQLAKNLNPLQVVDLYKTDPKVALRQFCDLPRVRVLVCGGDGTAAWILQSLEELQEVDPKPPVGILPLGTGNDLARVLGWGGGFANDLISELLMQIQEAHPAVLDRWEVNITPQDPGAPPPSPKKKPKEIVEFDHGARKGGRRGKSGNGGSGGSGRGDYSPRPTHDYAAANGAGDGPGGRPMGKSKTLIFQNYLGIGVDAQAALRFHRTRNVRPQLFFSAFTNKLLYGIFGARDFVEHSCAGMHQHVHLIADGVRRELPPETEGIILLNINSFAGRRADVGEQRGIRRELDAGRHGRRGGGLRSPAPRSAQLGGRQARSDLPGPARQGHRRARVPHARGRRAVGAGGVHHRHRPAQQGAHAAKNRGCARDERGQDGGYPGVGPTRRGHHERAAGGDHGRGVQARGER
jgi:hypothetical protein